MRTNKVWSVVFLCLAAMAVAMPAASADSVSVYQMDWFGGATGAPLISNSEWGHAVFDIAPTQSIRFLNIIGSDNLGVNQWLVQNVPILSSTASPNPGEHAINLDLGKLGITRGTSAAGRGFSYTIGSFGTTMPISGTPGTISATNGRLDFGYDFVGMGDDPSTPIDPTGYTPLDDPVAVDMGQAPGPTLPQSLPSPWNPIEVERDDMESVEQTPNGCMPGAAANSIYWLHKRYGLNIDGKTLEQLYGHLYGTMGTDPNKGTTIDGFLAGKEAFLQNKGVAMKTYRGKVTWDWIENEIDHGEDVELFYAWWGKVRDRYGNEKEQWVGHMVTIQGKYDDGTNRWLKLRDDEDHSNPGGTNHPRWTRIGSQYSGWMSLLDESKYTYVCFAHSESVPEPSALLVLGSGLMGIAALGRKKLFKKT